MSEPVLVLTTVAATADADTLARSLVTERLAACVNVLPAMQSTYRWKDAVEVETERQLLIKTASDRIDQLRDRLLALHPYDVPEFLILALDGGSAAYLAWLMQSTRPVPP